jgi:Short C-terminal domain
MENDLENGPRPVGDAEMDARQASIELPESVAKASELIQALERLSQVREKGILTDAEFEQEKKRILGD